MNTTANESPRRLRLHAPSLETNLALLAGLVTAAGLPPYPWTGLLVPIGLALFFGLMARSEHPGRLAWIFGLAHQTVVLHWLFLLIPAKTIPTRALVPLQAIAATIYVSAFYLVMGWVFGHLRRRLGLARSFLMLPALWAAMEFLRAQGELGFPWCLSGSCVIGTPMLGLARTGGELALGAGMAFLATALAAWRLRGRFGPEGNQSFWTVAGAGALLWTGLLIGSFLRPDVVQRPDDFQSVPSIRVAAVQADVNLEDKWQDARIDSTKIPYARFTAEAADAGAEFIVWAETAIPAYLRYDTPLLNWTRTVVRGSDAYLYTGFPDAERQPDGELRKYNSSGLFAPDGALLDRYAKHHLLPIGEAMPFTRYFPFLAQVDVGQAEWSPGDKPVPQRLELANGTFDFSGLICFESVFSGLARESVRAGSQCLVVLTNDGWFGQTAGPRQHTALARMRAVECGVPVIRCANNGISLVADENGRVLDSLDLGNRGYVRAEIQPGTAATLFAKWGNRPLLIFLLVWTGLVMNVRGKNE
jgi:apolipoprotein N-acyltransferase